MAENSGRERRGIMCGEKEGQERNDREAPRKSDGEVAGRNDREVPGKINREAPGKSGQRDKSAGLAVWALLARSSFYKVLAVVFLLAAVETALFCHTLQRGRTAALEVMIEESGARYLFLAALGAVFFILIRTGRILDNAGRYTTMRLRLAGERLFAIRAAYNVLCLLVLFAAQTALVFWFARAYRRMPGAEGLADGGIALRQMLFLAFYRSEFLHSLFPMAETGKWVRNVLLLLALGMEASGGAGRRRQVAQIALFLLAAVCFAGSIGTGWPDVICEAAFLVVIGTDIWEAYASRREARLGRATGPGGQA